MKGLLREPLLHFLVLGAVLAGARSFWEPALYALTGPEEIVITAKEQARLESEWRRETGRLPNTRELDALIQQRVNEEILLREARRLDLQERDPVVRQRLIRNMQFVEQSDRTDEQALMEAALALGMADHDPVVRRRLIQLMRHLIESRVKVTESDVREFFADNRQQFASPPRYDFRHIYFSHDRHGEAAFRAADETLARLTGQPGQAQQASDEQGDPFLLGAAFSNLTTAEIERKFGTAFARQLTKAEPGKWIGPLTSVYGQHLVRIDGINESRTADYSKARPRAVSAVYAQREQAALQTVLTAMQDRYRIEIENRSRGGAS